MNDEQLDSGRLPAGAIPPGSFIGRYKVVKRIGGPGLRLFQVVWQETEEELCMQLLEISISDPENATRFEQDVKALRAVNDVHLAKIKDFGIDENVGAYLVIENVQGKNVQQMIKDSSGLNELQFLDIFSQACAGLGALHKKGLAHKDLRIVNIFVSEDFEIKLLGYGAGKTARFPLDVGTDIFALGCAMYESLCGRKAFKVEDPIAALSAPDAAVRFSDLAPAKVVNEKIERLVFRCLNKNAEERYQNVQAIASDLKRIEEGQDLLPVKSGAGGGQKTINIVAIVIAVFLVLATGTFFGLKAFNNPKAQPDDAAVLQLKDEEKKADALAEKGEVASAEQIYNRLEPQYQNRFGKNSPERAEILYKLAKTQVIAGQVGPAADSFMVLAMMLKKDPSILKLDDRLSTIVFKMGKEQHFDKGNFDGASSIFKGAMLIETEAIDSSKARVSELTTWYARALYPDGDADRAAKFFKVAIKAASQPQSKDEMKAKAFAQAEYVRMMLSHPNLASDKEQLAKARKLVEESMRWRQKLKDEQGIEDSKRLLYDVKKAEEKSDD